MTSPPDSEPSNAKRPVFTWYSQWQYAYWFLYLFPALLLVSSIPIAASLTSWSMLASTAAALGCLVSRSWG